MTTASVDPDHRNDDAARRYIDEAASHLADLPVSEREELASGIADAIAEFDGTVVSYDGLVSRLGAPANFADEIRSSSGAPPRTPIMGSTPVSRTGPSILKRAAGITRRTLRWIGLELEPLWWVVRAMAVALLLFGLTGIAAGNDDLRVEITFILLLASFALGIWARIRRDDAPRDSKLLIRGATLIILGSVVVFSTAAYATNRSLTVIGDPYPELVTAPYGLAASDGRNITNIYAYDRSGSPLEDVRLYDQDGIPIEIGTPDFGWDPDRRRVLDTREADQLNTFPIRYYEPGTRTIRDPGAGWLIGRDAPRALSTPPLGTKRSAAKHRERAR